MKKFSILTLALVAAFVWTGCDSGDGTVDVETEIQATWVSSGDDIAPGLVALFGTTKITATFNANGTYTVLEERGTNPSVTYTGTYVTAASTSGTIRTITLQQGAPFGATSAGIYQVTDTSLRYEVAQTEPAIGATPPTPAGGFGSTVFGGSAQGELFIQDYVRQGN